MRSPQREIRLVLAPFHAYTGCRDKARLINQRSCCKLRHPLAGLAKRKHRLCFTASQSEIKDINVMPHVSAVCCAGERQHPELDCETKYYLRNRLVIVAGDLGHAWLHENLAISGKQGKALVDDAVGSTQRAHLCIPTSARQASILHKGGPYPRTSEEGIHLIDRDIADSE